MAALVSFLLSPAERLAAKCRLRAGTAFLRSFARIAFTRYQPERHYMRGPGPAWKAKHPGREDLVPDGAEPQA